MIFFYTISFIVIILNGFFYIYALINVFVNFKKKNLFILFLFFEKERKKKVDV